MIIAAILSSNINTVTTYNYNAKLNSYIHADINNAESCKVTERARSPAADGMVSTEP